MAYDIEGKNVLITGASSGIGAALAVGFAERGAVVGICARREDRLAEVLEACQWHSPESRMWTVDLADLHAVDKFALESSADMGGIDILINNAGIPKRRHITALTPEVVEMVMSINYFSPVRLTLALLPGLIERQGRIINICSVAARIAAPGEAAYAASKAAFASWSESLAIDLAGTGLKTHIVNPGVIDTELFHLPDNDASFAEVESLAPEAMVAPVLEQLENDTFEIFVPEWFADVAKAKGQDVGAFVEGVASWATERKNSPDPEPITVDSFPKSKHNVELPPIAAG